MHKLFVFLWLSECVWVSCSYSSKEVHGNVHSLIQEKCGFWHRRAARRVSVVKGQRSQGENWASADTKPCCLLVEFVSECGMSEGKVCQSFIFLSHFLFLLHLLCCQKMTSSNREMGGCCRYFHKLPHMPRHSIVLILYQPWRAIFTAHRETVKQRRLKTLQ